MKKIFLIGLVLLVLIGCATTLNRVQDQWGPPAKCEQREEFTICYYYFQKGRSLGYNPGKRGGIAISDWTAGWLCIELTCDKDGNVLKKRQYWVQPRKEFESPR